MGVIYVTATVRNPAEPKRCWEGEFLVDTGATETLVPRRHLEAIGIDPERQRVYGLADGSEVTMDIGIARIEFMDEVIGATIVFGEDAAEPLLGVVALESANVEVDPRNQRPRKLPVARLKRLRDGGRTDRGATRIGSRRTHRLGPPRMQTRGAYAALIPHQRTDRLEPMCSCVPRP